MPAGTDWTDAIIARLRDLHDEEETFSDIARILSREFRVKLSKNACIGKGRRIGLAARAHVPPPKPRKGQNRGGPRLKPVVLPGWEVALPPPVQGKLTIYQLDHNTCRYPFGDKPPYSYCGTPTKRGVRTTSGWSTRRGEFDEQEKAHY